MGSVLCHVPSSSESPASRSIAETYPVWPEGPTPDGGLFGGSLSLLERRLLFAGGLPGLLIYKLQFGLLIDPGCVACGATLARLRGSRGLLGERDVAYWHFSDLCDIRIESGIRTKADVRHLWVYALAER
jgi:hypothetical protein